MMTTIHIAFDNRAIDAAFESVFGAAAKSSRPKTTKTYCGKRVGFDFAQTHDKADCGQCLRAYHNEQSELSSILTIWPIDLPKPDIG